MKDFVTINALADSKRLEDGFDSFWKSLLEQVPPECPPMSDKLRKLLKVTAYSAFISGTSWAVASGTEHAAKEVQRITGSDPAFKDN